MRPLAVITALFSATSSVGSPLTLPGRIGGACATQIARLVSGDTPSDTATTTDEVDLTLTVARALRWPSTAPRLVYLGKLGAGGQGEVHLFREPGEKGATFVVKMSRGDLGRAGLAQEGWALRTLGKKSVKEGFPKVAAQGALVVPFGDNQYMLRMSAVEGGSTLGKYVNGLPLLGAGDPATRQTNLLRRSELALALSDRVADAQEAGVSHRDVKPDNVLIDRHGKLWLIDFGAAGKPGSYEPSTPYVGTAGFVPEFVMGTRKVDPRQDTFGLAQTAQRMFFDADAHRDFRNHFIVRQEQGGNARAVPFVVRLPSSVPPVLRWALADASGTPKDYRARLSEALAIVKAGNDAGKVAAYREKFVNAMLKDNEVPPELKAYLIFSDAALEQAFWNGTLVLGPEMQRASQESSVLKSWRGKTFALTRSDNTFWSDWRRDMGKWVDGGRQGKRPEPRVLVEQRAPNADALPADERLTGQR